MNINEIQSELKMDNFYFAECSISRTSSIESGSLNIELDKEIEELDKASNYYCVKLTLTIGKESGDLSVKVVAIATFSMDNQDADLVRSIMNTNAVAIMFPFIRSQVSLLTTQPGLTPIVLPPINTSKL